MDEPRIIPISTDRRLLGEGPHWMENGQCLLFVDILRGTLHRYFNETKRHQTLHIEDVGTESSVGFVIPVENRQNEFVIGVGRTLSSVIWSPDDPDVVSKKPHSLLSVDTHDTTTRFNDAKCDPAGRLWAGTLSKESISPEHLPHLGALYRIGPDLKSALQARKITVSNGLSWNKNKDTMYYIDSHEYRVDAFDYNDASGDISNRRPVIDFKASGVKGIPDGMAIDMDDNIWVACYYGGQVICVDPSTGKIIRKVELPSKCTTSCCWGGPDYSTLYVTSATKSLSREEMELLPHGGKTFAVTGLGVKGLPPSNFKVDDTYCLK